MRNRRSFVLTSLALVTLSIYLFVDAPPPLAEQTAVASEAIPIADVFGIVAAENDIVRALYTQEVVGKGSLVGLRFDELWRRENVEAGPLPALFLREVARRVRRSPVPLGLFLGSDFPISPANRFAGEQADVFERIRETRAAEIFFEEGTRQHTAIYPDFASVAPCVGCHNEHPDSPKKDWVLDDVMGATTWTYPKGRVSHSEAIAIVRAVREGFRNAYSDYLKKAETFASPPEIGSRWPAEGYFLPSADVFMNEFARRASPSTVSRMLAAGRDTPAERDGGEPVATTE